MPVPVSTRPIVTLLSDFGTRDHYVAAMKAALIRHCPDVRMIDVTHEVPRHDILYGSIMLERAVDGFLPGTVHLAVVDPGVGTDRRILVAEINGQTVLCPDNGLITWAWRRLGPAQAHRLEWRPASSSNTFHGRDIMAPVAGMLASGEKIDEIATPIHDPVLLDIAPAAAGSTTAQIIHIDAFGNATTNFDSSMALSSGDKSFHVQGKSLGPLRRTYLDVMPGKPLALIGSSGLLEIAVRDGSAADQLHLRVGDIVTIH
jgi:S-adenosylmethionine hydrolase